MVINSKDVALQTSAFERKVGHPPGLFVLFFAEMWERFSFYGMRALLVFYMTKGFLKYGDAQAYALYGAYTSLVYMTPYFGGLIADKILGARRSVILGGLLMAAGHLLMTIEESIALFGALALLILGNGFFKPNISTIVGSLYGEHNKGKRDGGFTIFYMGINLGAAMAPLLCGYIGEVYGWHYGFGLATIGMLIGLAIFVAPSIVTQILIGLGALVSAGIMVVTADNPLLLWIANVPVALALLVAAGLAVFALNAGSFPKESGAPPSQEGLGKRQGLVLLGTLIALPAVTLLIQYGSSTIFTLPAIPVIGGEVTLLGFLLVVIGALAFGSIFREAVRSDLIERHRLFVVLIMCFFSMLFWAFFEQAGSSVNNYTDRNVDRVTNERVLAAEDVGKPLKFNITQEQLGYQTSTLTHKIGSLVEGTFKAAKVESGSVVKPEQEIAVFTVKEDDKEVEKTYTLKGINPTLFEGKLTWVAKPGDALKAGDPLFTIEARRTVTMDYLTELRDEAKKAQKQDAEVEWMIDQSHVGMAIGASETPASVFQAANPGFILIFGLIFTALWGFLAKRKIEPSIPTKFALGLLQLALGFGAFWWGVQQSDERGMSSVVWLLIGYLLQTTGELCLSPVGLSMVTKLSPQRMVSTVMGAWFLATSFSQYLAAIIAQFTGVSHGGEESKVIPVPKDTAHVYGDVFYQIMIAGLISTVILIALIPLLKKWMHPEAPMTGEGQGGGH